MTDAQPDKPKRERSPQFPFIPLEKAVARAREFSDGGFTRHPARVANAAGAWGFKAKSSGGLQTVAALKGYGLLDEIGSGDERRVQLTDLARRIITAKQESIRNKAIAEAALKPKAIAERWSEWGADRPPDAECLDTLTLEKGFTEDSAKRFLKVYDDTIRLAKLSASDKMSESESDNGGDEGGETPLYQSPKVPPAPKMGVDLMAGERIVFTEENAPNQYVKLVASGEVDEFLLDALKNYTERQRKRLERLGRSSRKEDQEATRDDEKAGAGGEE